MEKRKPITKSAFTLIELLVVVAIIGILAAVGVVAYNGYTSSAKSNTIKSNHKLIVKQVNLIITMCEIEGSVQFMSTLNSKKFNAHACYGNVQEFFQSYFINHMNNQMEWINTSSSNFPHNWNGKNMYVLQEGTMANEYEGFVFLAVPSSSNKSVSINIFSCFKSPCNNIQNRIETFLKFDQW